MGINQLEIFLLVKNIFSSGFRHSLQRFDIRLLESAEMFVKEIFEKLDYNVSPQKPFEMFDFLAQKKDEKLLVEVKLRGIETPKARFIAIFQDIESFGKEYSFYIVTFDRSKIVKELKKGFQRYFPKDFRVDLISVEDLLGLSDYTPHCGSLDKDFGIELLRDWRKRMELSTIHYFESWGFDRPKEIALSTIKLADKRGKLTIDDIDITKTLSEKMIERDPSFFESYTFYCEGCGKKYRETPVTWSNSKNMYEVLCPECKRQVEKVQLKIPITVNIQTVILDTSAIIDGALSKIIEQKLLPEGVYVIIPEVVDQELEMMEKPYKSFNENIKSDLRRKFREADKELRKLVDHDTNGLIRLRRHEGKRLKGEEIRLKIEGVDRHTSDRLLIESCKQIGGAILVTKDKPLATRAAADKINVFLVQKA